MEDSYFQDNYTFDHVAIFVTDLEKSIEFYDLLGFKEHHRYELGALGAVGKTTGIPGMEAVGVYLQHINGGPYIEVVHFKQPPPYKDADAPVKNRLGINHIALRVKDVKKEYDRLIAAGVPALGEPAYVKEAHGWSVHMLDPDKVRVQLLSQEED